MTGSFSDHFSRVSAEYARYRPRYPPALFASLAALAPRAGTAWDCATGNGQAAVALAERFERVIATDASAEQIAQAPRHPRVSYAVATAEASGLEGGSVDLVTVAQALHWFDLPAFYAEARRVLRPGGILAVWSYGRIQLPSRTAQRVFDSFYDGAMGPYWPPERQLVEEGYRSLDFPFEELPPPALSAEARLTLDELAGYIRTWSATQACARATGRDPVPDLVRELARVWGGPGERWTARWPLAIRIGRTPG